MFCALLTAVAGARLIYVQAHGIGDIDAIPSGAYIEDNRAISGMFFSSDNVTEEYEYDDAYCLLYDDPDANMFGVEIVVDLETYQRVLEAHRSGSTLLGSLVLNDDHSYDGVEVFTFMPDPFLNPTL